MSDVLDGSAPITITANDSRELVELIKLVSETHFVRMNQLDILEELRSINEGLRWQQEYFKTQAEDVQQALRDRESERQAIQKDALFAEEVQRRVDMVVHQKVDTAVRLAAQRAATAIFEQEQAKRSEIARKAAATRKRNRAPQTWELP